MLKLKTVEQEDDIKAIIIFKNITAVSHFLDMI